jgi:D-alanyl-D-alanine carboxypeptidase/D-alanyl-D-alanine-endopeptidase (penicillin-binding protein 4)
LPAKKIHTLLNRLRLLKIALLILSVSAGCKTGKLMIDNRAFPRYISENSILGKGFTGLAVFDPVKGKFLVRYNAGNFFTPASVIKLFTFYTAEKMMEDSIPGIRYCISADTLFFSGMGDPTFLDPRFPAQPVFDFLKQSPYPLAYCPANINQGRFGYGWAWDDYLNDYSAERSSLPVYGNLVHLENTPADTSLKITPRIFRENLTIRKDTSVASSEMTVYREEGQNKFYVNYDSKDSITWKIPFITNNDLTIRLLEDTLRKPIKTSVFPAGCRSEFVYSQPRDSVMKLMLTVSDNFIAEQTLMGISAMHYDTISSDRVIQLSMDSLFASEKNSMNWMDGSGLSRYNQFTPESIIHLLIRMKNEIPENKLYSLLAVNGKPGTLARVLKNEDPFIFGKSGSMSHVYNLAGYLKAGSGKTLVFCIMNNNFNISVMEARIESAKILRYIRNQY